jgi:hypothetical protein
MDWGPFPIWFTGFGSKPIPVAEMSFAAPGGNSKSASSQPSGPRTLLPVLARQFDRDVPRGAHDPRASVRVGAANDRFQKKNELFRKHGVASLMAFSGSVSAGGL